jgi:hypothetical protein
MRRAGWECRRWGLAMYSLRYCIEGGFAFGHGRSLAFEKWSAHLVSGLIDVCTSIPQGIKTCIYILRSLQHVEVLSPSTEVIAVIKTGRNIH